MKRRVTVLMVACAAMMLVPSIALALPSMPSTLFQTSAGCGCHAAFVDQWSVSMHAKALTDPVGRRGGPHR